AVAPAAAPADRAASGYAGDHPAADQPVPQPDQELQPRYRGRLPGPVQHLSDHRQPDGAEYPGHCAGDGNLPGDQPDRLSHHERRQPANANCGALTMAASEVTTQRPPSEAPPVNSVGVMGWVRENLFSSISNTILTILSAALLYALLRRLITFVFFEADWRVITQNLVLFAIGQYPRLQAWRPAASLGLVVVLGGLSLIFWTRGRVMRRILMGLWLLSPIIIVVLLTGLRGSCVLPFVRTQLWSSRLLTFMLPVVGIVASFPLGVLLALGRRGDMVIIRILSTIYIELIRGVPLISILFMAQVLLPLFVGRQNLDVVLRSEEHTSELQSRENH